MSRCSFSIPRCFCSHLPSLLRRFKGHLSLRLMHVVHLSTGLWENIHSQSITSNLEMDGLPRIKDEPNDDSFSFLFSFKPPKLDRKSAPSDLSTLKNGMQTKLEQDLPTEHKDPVIFQGKHESSASDEKFSTESKVDLSFANKPTTSSTQSRPKRNISTSGYNGPQTVFTHSDLQRMLVSSSGPVVVTENFMLLQSSSDKRPP